MNSFLVLCDKYQIDTMLLSETQTKWTPSTIDKMQQRIKQMSKEAAVIGADSGQWNMSPRDYLPGGTLSIFTGK